MGMANHSLRFMYNMERFATQIYRTQRSAFKEREIIDKLSAAADNEQQHVDYLKARIAELNGAPSRVGFLFQMAGRTLGFVARIFGKLFILNTDIWVEKRAIKDYGSFLRKVDFDEKSVVLIEKIIADEKIHVSTWQRSIEILESQT
jgi:demethoxyubiquinone hydroxylase (CLK1/Coq7/Cat5 family)